MALVISNRTTWKAVKNFLKSNRVTKQPVRWANRERVRLRWRLKTHAKALEYPTVINIETTNHCNEKCWFCPRADATRGFGFVALDMVKKIVDESKPHGPVMYYMHKDGEPLMHPQILDIIEYIKRAHPGNTVRLTTNGTLLTETKARRLLELGVDQIRVGVRSAKPETFKKIHGLDAYDKVVGNVHRLLALKKELRADKTMVIVQIVVCDDTKDEVDLFRKQWGDKDVHMEIKDFMSWGGWADDGTLEKGNDANDPRRPPCIDPFHNLVVNWDGKVSLCSLDWDCKVQLGHVGTQSVKDVWHGDAVKAVRQSHLNGKFDQNSMCANCQEWRYVPNLFWKNRLVPNGQKWI